MREFLLFIGLVVLTVGLFSFRQRWIRRLGVLLVGVTTFAAGYLPTGSVWVGFGSASVWLLLPVVEILLRVRALRLPLQKELRQTAPPARGSFPELHEMSDEIESAGFEHVEDLGWEMDGYRQFFRVFGSSVRREEVAITYVEQNEVGFYFVSVTSRTEEGLVYMTWNCPVSASLKFPPTVRFHRVPQIESVGELLEAHILFMKREGVALESLRAVGAESVRTAMENDLAAQMEHNLRAGVLKKDEEGFGRYSWRGMVFLWYQVVRDIIKLS